MMIRLNKADILITSISLLFFSGVLAYFSIPKVPVKEFEAYNKVKSEARKTKAYMFDWNCYANADFFREEAFREWQAENEKWWLKRDYSDTRRMILIALSMAEEAKEKTDKISNSMFETSQFESLSQEEINTIKSSIVSNSENWMKWYNEALTYSKDKQTNAIIIDKYRKKCFVYNKGENILTFDTESGDNPFIEKKSLKDGATPTGKYYITSKKEKFPAPYYLVLNLNYHKQTNLSPGENNLEHQADLLKGNICIHGGGGQSVNWTNGSIALKNDDMTKIFDLTKIGTPVIIVGTFDKTLIRSFED